MHTSGVSLARTVIPNEARNPAPGPTARSGRRSVRKRQVVAWVLGLLCAVGRLTGCAAPSRAEPARALLGENDWPARITSGLERLVANTPKLLVGPRDGGPRGQSEDERARGPEAALRILRSVADGCGIVLEIQRPATERPRGSTQQTQLAFVSYSPWMQRDRCLARGRTSLPTQITWEDVQAGVRWHLYEPHAVRARGLVVHLGGNKYVRRALLKREWAVLSSTGTGRYSQRRASAQTFEIACTADVERVAAEIAASLDDELADWPYSLEAVLAYLAQHRPDLPQRPLAIMGFSIGALGLPAVVARLPERFDAAVLVAGGANLLEISQRTSKRRRGIELRWRGLAPETEHRQRLYAAYLRQAKLDPYCSAAALRGMSVLVFHAHFDQVVPAANGELLYARLGRPARRAYPVGHRLLLRLVTRLEAGSIVDWVEAAVRRRAAALGEGGGRWTCRSETGSAARRRGACLARAIC
jgi:pimeloyl-ACP methyl ester carboxylesterase